MHLSWRRVRRGRSLLLSKPARDLMQISASSSTYPRGSPPISALLSRSGARARVRTGRYARYTTPREQSGRRGAAHSRRISIRLESNEVPPMSPSLVKWIPRSIAFSFQDWFMPERDLRPGCTSIAARRAIQPASQPVRAGRLALCGCFTWILLTPSCSLLLPSIPRAENVRMPRDVTRRTPRMESDLFDCCIS